MIPTLKPFRTTPIILYNMYIRSQHTHITYTIIHWTSPLICQYTTPYNLRLKHKQSKSYTYLTARPILIKSDCKICQVHVIMSNVDLALKVQIFDKGSRKSLLGFQIFAWINIIIFTMNLSWVFLDSLMLSRMISGLRISG